ncbi:hypothetical protein EXIGLDRAFT_79605 [Exidia glandulosa HHB12029]|uniref:Uncharacterized protein n=1 Tax=Exidia glandulosa HHB12029 TaxID=1314781 RepID=A0A166AIH8_EXIGL|nr:hypothetical protein EXIGLDRAFT_79605 [Exidia glandulosa HHB12029]
MRSFTTTAAAFFAFAAVQVVAGPLSDFGGLLGLRSDSYVNEYHESFVPQNASLASRALPADIYKQVDTAIAAQGHKVHFFWTGSVPPAKGTADFVGPIARTLSKKFNGVTIDEALSHLPMPGFGQMTSADIALWRYASLRWAETSAGEVYVVYGGVVRHGNTFETELPALKKNRNVKKVWRIDSPTRGHTGQRKQIWPADPCAAGKPKTSRLRRAYEIAVRAVTGKTPAPPAHGAGAACPMPQKPTTPAKPPVRTPTKPPVRKPTKPPVRKPTRPPVRTPAKPPVRTPTKPTRPVTRPPVTRKPVTRKPVTRKPVTRKPVTRKPTKPVRPTRPRKGGRH